MTLYDYFNRPSKKQTNVIRKTFNVYKNFFQKYSL